MEKFFSVAVELEDGHRKILAVKASGSGQAFAQAKAAPNVRRVGKVTEIDASDFDHVSNGGTLKESAPRDRASDSSHKSSADRKSSGHKSADHKSPAHPKSEKPAAAAPAERPSAAYTNTGPRVVSHARTRTGEQPFKHLQAPPERPKPPAPPAKPTKPKAEKPEKPAKPAKPKAAKAPSKKSATKTDDNTRIIKSRRQDGPPYLLQRGTWKEVGGKRTFTVESEKGFDTREAAEAELS